MTFAFASEPQLASVLSQIFLMSAFRYQPCPSSTSTPPCRAKPQAELRLIFGLLGSSSFYYALRRKTPCI